MFSIFDNEIFTELCREETPSFAKSFKRLFLKGTVLLPISFISKSFEKEFLDDEESETDLSPLVITIARFKRNLSRSILVPNVLKPEEGSEITVSALFYFLDLQTRTGRRFFRTSGYKTILFLRNKNGMIRTVSVSWFGGGWCIIMSPARPTHLCRLLYRTPVELPAVSA